VRTVAAIAAEMSDFMIGFRLFDGGLAAVVRKGCCLETPCVANIRARRTASPRWD
jgi:hypothetical protein